MSELSRQIAANTQGVYGAHRDLVALKARSRERKKAAYEGIADALKDAGDEYRKHLSWRDAQAEEREIAEVENAYSLGYATKGGEGARIALSSMRPKTAKGAVLLSARLREASKDQQYEVEWKAKEAQRAAEAQAKRKADLMDTALSYAELQAKQKEAERKDAKDAADREAETKRQQFRTAAEMFRWWRSQPAEKRPNPDDLPVPDNQREMVEKQHSLPSGYLAGMTHRQMREMLAAENARAKSVKPDSEPNLRLTPYETQTLKGIDAEIAQLSRFIDTNAWEKSQAGPVNTARDRLATLRNDRAKITGNLPGSPTRQDAPPAETEPDDQIDPEGEVIPDGKGGFIIK